MDENSGGLSQNVVLTVKVNFKTRSCYREVLVVW